MRVFGVGVRPDGEEHLITLNSFDHSRYCLGWGDWPAHFPI
jgi:hypothetical protein